MTLAPRSVAIVGASGYVGQVLVRSLLQDLRGIQRILALDIKEAPFPDSSGILTFEEMDVRSARLGGLLAEHNVDTVIHLACVVNPPEGMKPNEQYAIDVDGTHNVMESCVEHGVVQVMVTSSGAAYGYHVDNPPWIHEDCALRGNEEFPYSRHKRLVEELLAKYRARHPELLQTIFRPGTILGLTTQNRVTALFERSVMFKISDGDSRFVFVWDEDVASCIVKGMHERRAGIFNLAADGAMTLDEIAGVTGAQVLSLPAGVFSTALSVLRWMGFSQHGPEHVPFLRHRPVLANDALKSEFGFVPTKTSRQAFETYWGAYTVRQKR